MDILTRATQRGINSALNLGIDDDGIIGTETTLAKEVFYNWLRQKFADNNYMWNQNYNLIGIRTDDVYTNKFTDIGVITIANDFICFPISTKPGIGKVLNPPTVAGVKGVAVMKEGQYVDLYEYNGAWWSGMPFLLQKGSVIAYRDSDLNTTITRTVEQSDNDLGYRFSLNFHSYQNASWKWNIDILSYLRADKTYSNLSEGCQVTQALYMDLIDKYFKNMGKKITYTLLHL